MFEPLVTETGWPTEKARIGGYRKKRSVQALFSYVDLAMAVQPEPVLEKIVQFEAVLEGIVQPGVVLDVVQPEPEPVVLQEVLQDVVQSEAVSELVQTEPVVVQPRGRPSEGDAKKTRSMNHLLGIEAKASKSKPKKKKSNASKKK